MERRCHQGTPTTADFRAAGLPFEFFLRFSQLPAARREQAERVFWLTYGDKLSGSRTHRDLERVRTMRRELDTRIATLEATRAAAATACERAAKAIARDGGSQC